VSKNCPPCYSQTFNTTTCRMRLGLGNPNTTKIQRGMTDISAAAKAMSKGRDSETQLLHKLKVVVVGGISGVRILLLIPNNLVLLLDQLLRRLSLKLLHRLC